MHVDKLLLKNYRNFEQLDLDLTPHVNIFYGQNAQGKTNLLESIYFCATGRSHRTSYDRECITHDQNEAYIKIIYTRHKQDTVEIHLRKNGRKSIAVNNYPVKRIDDLFGCFTVVIFSPEDLSLIKNGPQKRRRFMDMEICQVDPVYLHDLQKYHKVLRQRNQLLKTLNPVQFSYEEQLLPWDMQLVDYGVKVIKKREAFIEKLSQHTAHIHDRISNGTEVLELAYEKDTGDNAEEFLQVLKKQASKDIRYGSTASGPHKDDIAMAIDGQDVRVYGSQGQQRTTALSMKLAELELMEAEIGTPPVLLLDDVMSELDRERQLHMIQYIERCQTILTCTGVEDSIRNLPAGGMFEVSKGHVQKK